MSRTDEQSGEARDYADKRSFDKTPEPPPQVPGDVDPGAAPPGKTFVIQQHHARRLHFDLRLEMLNGGTPVLVSWAVPKNLPLRTGKVNLAVHVEDHPFEYGSFSGTIPKGEYGGGEVRIFDHGTYELLEQEAGKLSFRLTGERMQGVWHLFRTKDEDEKNWLVRLRAWEGPERDPLPSLAPMMATLVADAFDDNRFIFEPKWDGVRALAVCDPDKTALFSRTKREITATYPELARLNDRLVCRDAIVDGEVVAMRNGRPSFERLQNRINVQKARDVARMTQEIPVTYLAFDLLYLDGKSLIERPIEERKQMLEELVVPSQSVQISPFVAGEGTALFNAAGQQQLEGIVAKKLGSPYRPGKRTRDWLKIKTLHDADVVIGGWTQGEGSRSGSFGALLVGAYTDDGLRFLGAVGTGFSQRTLDDLVPRLKAVETDEPPFISDPTGTKPANFGKPIRAPHWARPELVAKVEFRELTSGGRLRAPSFKGLREDKEADDVMFSDVWPPGWEEPPAG
ncbi:MAG: non-homologous end-joining DNA ligase [Actinomycetota bacterium]